MISYIFHQQDWSSIQGYLGGDPNHIIQIKPKTHYETRKVHEKAQDRNISLEGIQNTCRMLCSEIQLYKYLLKVGKNLNYDDRLESFKDLNATCPIEANVNHC